MGFSIGGTVLGTWLGQKPKKKYHVLQKVIDDLQKSSVVWILVKEMRMGFSIARAVLKKWLAERFQKKKIKALQNVIEELNKALESISENEKEYLQEAASEREKAAEYGLVTAASAHLQRKESDANYLASWRPLLLDELVLFEALVKIEIQALQDGDFGTKKTRQNCFFF